MRNIGKWFYYFIRRCLIRITSKKITLESGAIIRKGTKIEPFARIGDNSDFYGILQQYSYIGSRCTINASIGKFSSISTEVKTIYARHPVDACITSSPFFYQNVRTNHNTLFENTDFSEFNYADPENKIAVSIGNDVWIGWGAKILGGVKIADGAIIGAGAVVTKDVPPYAIVGGIPAKVIRYRFDEKQISALLSIKWWNWPIEKIKSNGQKFWDVKQFIDKFGEIYENM